MKPGQRLARFAAYVHVNATVYGGTLGVATAVVGWTLVALVKIYIYIYNTN